MNDQYVRYNDMFGCVINFGRDNAADFDAQSQTAANFANLVSIGQEIANSQAGTGAASVTSRSSMLAKLRLELKNIARTAREIEDDEPGFADKFRMPINNSQAALLLATRQTIVELKNDGTVAKFAAYELPDTICTDLEALLQEIDSAKDEQDSDNVEGVENTAALKLAINAGKALVDKLNAAMHNKYKSQPAKLAAWTSACHIERAARRRKTASITTSVTPTAQPSS